MKRFLILHAIQTFPVSLMNRDDSGNPKTAIIGGEERLRLSSQNQKRSMRMLMRDRARAGVGPLHTATWAQRTREWPQATIGALTSLGVDRDVAARAVRVVFTAAGLTTEYGKDSVPVLRTKVMIYAPDTAATVIAAAMFDHVDEFNAVYTDAASPKKDADAPTELGTLKAKEFLAAIDVPADLAKTAKTAVIAGFDPAAAIDLALTGRMLTEVPGTRDPDGAVQMAHAIGVEPTQIVDDLWTAVDDNRQDRDDADDQGAGGYGYRPMSASTMYRHVVVDLDLLRSNLSNGGMNGDALDTAIAAAVSEFTRAFYLSVSSAVKTSSAHTTLPAALLATYGDLPLNYIEAFNRAIDPAKADPDVPHAAAQRLLTLHDRQRREAGIDGGWLLWNHLHDVPSVPDTVTVLDGIDALTAALT